MATAVRMPQLGVTMTEATLLRWLKAPGDSVEAGEPLAEIETDKLSAEVTAGSAGVLRRIVAAEGTIIPVTGLLAVVGGAGEPESVIDALVSPAARQAPRASDANAVRATPLAKRLAAERGLDLAAMQGAGPGGRITMADVRTRSLPEAPPVSSSAATDDTGFVRASPLARRLAREQGIALTTITGSGPEGRVLERDVRTAATASAVAAPPAEPRRVETIKVDGMRRLIGERMLQSVQSSAQITLTTEADATGLVELRSHLLPAARVYGHRPPTYTDVLVHLVARVLPAHPLLNSSLLGAGDVQEIACWADVNIGVAVALERGLVVPVVRNADQKSLDVISADLATMVERARAKSLTTDDVLAGTFTVTNLGALEVDGFTPIINPPQCAILGVGRIHRKPAVFQDQIAIRQLLTLSLTVDHRIVDGAPAAAFLLDVKRAIEALQTEATTPAATYK
ncbi:MAG TPA: 2-oxo acid dehydrogenase subunit E2 [Chloroflexota bacterium]|jgi:pyruvate dehydrogenase E2 component (dihydrolipoamide acetyltransferase)|nr:2-oxo acid dehydrogenase subunit E2 [Chloroflexota bacterium]